MSGQKQAGLRGGDGKGHGKAKSTTLGSHTLRTRTAGKLFGYGR
jgi:hypothetical protein